MLAFVLADHELFMKGLRFDLLTCMFSLWTMKHLKWNRVFLTSCVGLDASLDLNLYCTQMVKYEH